MIKWIREFFDDNTSGGSMMRLMFALWMVMFCSIVVYVDIKAKDLKPIPEGYIYITGLLAAAKVGQRMWGEKDNSTINVTGTISDTPGIVTASVSPTVVSPPIVITPSPAPLPVVPEPIVVPVSSPPIPQPLSGTPMPQ